MAANQPTILVKKADGTFVRVPLADLKKKPVAPPVVPVVEVPKVEPVVEKVVEPVVEVKPTVSVLQKPVQPVAMNSWIKKDRAVAPTVMVPKKVVEPVVVKSKPADFKSPLEDSDLPASALGVKTSVTRDSEVDKVVKQLSFTILPSFLGRLKSVVQLRLKDVRGANETRDIALRSIKDGGLGLTSVQADELEKKCVVEMELADKGVVTPLKVWPKAVVPTADDLPQKFVEPLVPANTTPFNSFIHETDQPSTIVPLQHDVPEFKISSAFKPKPVIRDVISKSVEMGPIEEIKFFRLIDLRRLANSPVEAANRLKQKFINLKEESVLLFLDAARAWRESLLYLEYLEMVDLAFNKHVHLAAVVVDKEKINLEEIKAIVNMEKELGI